MVLSVFHHRQLDPWFFFSSNSNEHDITSARQPIGSAIITNTRLSFRFKESGTYTRKIGCWFWKCRKNNKIRNYLLQQTTKFKNYHYLNLITHYCYNQSCRWTRFGRPFTRSISLTVIIFMKNVYLQICCYNYLSVLILSETIPLSRYFYILCVVFPLYFYWYQLVLPIPTIVV